MLTRICFAALALVAVLSAQFPPPTWGSYITSGTHSANTFNSTTMVEQMLFVPRSSAAITSIDIPVLTTTNPPTAAYIEIVKVYDPSGVLTVTYDDSGDLVNRTAHPFVAGSKVRFSGATLLPGGINIAGPWATFYVCSTALAANAFAIGTGYSAGDCTGRVTDFSGSSGTQAVREFVVSADSTVNVADGWNTFTFTGAPTLTAGETYAVWMRNASGTPASSTFQHRYISNFGSALGTLSGTNGSPSWVQALSTTTGATWAAGGMALIRIVYSDGTYTGIPFSGVASGTGVATGERVYGTLEIGNRYVAPISGLKIRGAYACIVKNGSPTANLRFRLYTGANASESLTATTGAIDQRQVTSSASCIDRYFSSTYTVTAGSPFRIVLSPTNTADTSGNSYSPYIWTFQNDSNSRALIPGYEAINSNGTWSYTNTNYVMVGVILDHTDPFPAASSGGGSFAILP